MVDLILDEIIVKAHDRNYSIHFFEELSLLNKRLDLYKDNCYFIIDEKFNKLNKFDSYIQNDNLIFVKSSESIKNLEFAKELILKLKNLKINRNSKIIVIGGGTLQDVSQFVSSILYRGVEFIFVPTTLQALTDSCIGGKTSLNLDFYKNQLGTFYSPYEVLQYASFVNTLDIWELKGGYAELIKLLIIGGYKNFDQFYKSLAQNIYELDNLKQHIHQALIIKKKYVEKDEFDFGIRKVLNYGHTFAHAIETIVENKITHGNATALGMNIANYYSYKKGLVSKKFFKLHFNFFYLFYEFDQIKNFKNISGKSIVEKFIHDKKMKSNGNIELILPISKKIKIKEVEIDSELENIIDEFLNLL